MSRVARAYGAAAEAQGRRIRRPVGLRPAAVAGTEDELALHPLPRHQALDPHPHQPDPGTLQAEGVVQRRRGRVDLPGDVGGVGQGPGAGDRGEVGEPHLQRDRAAGDPGGAHPPGDLGGESQQLAQDHGRVVGVAAEGLVRPHALVGILGGPTGRERAPVGAPGEVVDLGARRHPDAALEGGQRGVCHVADGPQSETVQLFAGLLPHAVELTHVERVQEAGHLARRYDEHSVGLGPPAGQLGDRDRPGHPDRAGDPLLVGDPGPDVLGDLQRAAETAGGPADVEERLVEGDRLDQRGDLPEDLHHRGGDDLEVGVVR